MAQRQRDRRREKERNGINEIARHVARCHVAKINTKCGDVAETKTTILPTCIFMLL